MRPLPRRIKAVAIHLLGSLLLAGAAAAVIFLIWYPYPHAYLSGGIGLLVLVAGVDAVLGPLITAVIAGPSKPWPELRRDLLVVITLQIAAFAYGVYVIASARPVVVAFEVDLVRVVRAGDVDVSRLHEAPASLRDLSWTGPRLIAAVKPEDPKQQLHSIDQGLSGIHLAMVPSNWREYRTQSAAAWAAAKPLAQLARRYPERAALINELVKRTGRSVDSLRYLPLLSGRESWVVVVGSPNADIVGYLPVDGFF